MKFLAYLICLLTAIAAQAQTYYYAHTKTVYADGRVEVQNGNSGQFVCRTDAYGVKKCYDSTSNGRDHLNGSLFYVGTNNGNEVYKGKSYFGPNTSYQFNDTKGLLNIKDANGNIYVYHRQQAPAGRTRSSLLIPGASLDGYDIAEHVDPYVPDTPTETTPSRDDKRKKVEHQRSDRECGYCKGSGRVRASIGVSGYGVSNRKKLCPTCKEYYYVTEDHWHACPQCKGTGRR